MCRDDVPVDMFLDCKAESLLQFRLMLVSFGFLHSDWQPFNMLKMPWWYSRAAEYAGREVG